MTIKPRIISKKLIKLLDNFGAVLIYGPKLSGKTFLAEQYSRSCYYMENLGTNENFLLIQTHQEKKILEGEKPRLIDEWQICPSIWDKIRFWIDQSKNQKSQYILTGSSTLYNKNIVHSGASRIARIKMNTYCLCEVSDHLSKIKLIDLFDNPKIDLIDFKTNNDLFDYTIDFMVYGKSWPANIKNEIFYSKQYIDSIINADVNQYINMEYKPKTSLKILNSLSRLNTTQLNISTVLSDIDNVIERKTLDKYLQVYEILNLFEFIEPWNFNIRSKYKMRTKSKIYWCDPSLGLYLLNVNSQNLMKNDLNTLGIYFENLVIRDLLVFCEIYDANLHFYLDEKGNEIDAIIHMPNGKWAAIEIKLGGYETVEKAKDKLNYTLGLIEPKSNILAKPVFKMIITMNGDAYYFDDTIVIPFAHLDLS